MDMNEYIRNLVNCNHLIGEDIINNDNFSEDDLILVRDRIGDMITNLEFWIEQDNQERFCYELKNHINWMLENFS